jgi:hypothetical protein
VLLDGKPVGVFQWVVAPPWRCIELKLPLPKFLAAAGRAGAARVAGKRLGAAAERVAAAAATPEAVRAKGEAAAAKEKGEAEEEEGRRSDFLGFEGRQRGSRDAEQKALEEKREYDRLSRRGRQVAELHDAEALVAADRARQSTGAERAKALAVAQERRAQAAATRQGARALREEAQAREKEAGARRKESQQERASWRRAEETRASAQKKGANPVQKATGESNAGLRAPSLFAHLPFPATVEIQVSWSQIGKTWVAGLVGAAAEMLKYYVGFVFDGVLAPGKGKVATFLLDLLKSGINDTLIDGGAKYLVDGKWPLKISKKLGPVKLSASCEPDSATGTHKWKVTLEHKSNKVGLGSTTSKGSIEGHGWTPEKAGVEMDGRRLAEHTFSKPSVDYSHGVPTVNGGAP